MCVCACKYVDVWVIDCMGEWLGGYVSWFVGERVCKWVIGLRVWLVSWLVGGFIGGLNQRRVRA